MFGDLASASRARLHSSIWSYQGIWLPAETLHATNTNQLNLAHQVLLESSGECGAARLASPGNENLAVLRQHFRTQRSLCFRFICNYVEVPKGK